MDVICLLCIIMLVGPNFQIITLHQPSSPNAQGQICLLLTLVFFVGIKGKKFICWVGENPLPDSSRHLKTICHSKVASFTTSKRLCLKSHLLLTSSENGCRGTSNICRKIGRNDNSSSSILSPPRGRSMQMCNHHHHQ